MARHLDFMDGALPTLAAARLQAHVASCTACARYDRVVRKGIDLVRDVPELVPATDFERRLEHRLFHVADERLQQQRQTGGATALVVAAMIAMLAWSPLLLDERATDGVAVMNATAPERAAGAARSATPPLSAFAELNTAPAFMNLDTWYALPASAPHAATVAALPGPYSPLVVTPPAHRAVRTVASEYAAEQ